MMNDRWFDEVIPRKLYLGSMPTTDADVAALKSCGIDAVLTIQEEHEYGESLAEMDEFLWRRIPIRDGNIGGVPQHEDVLEAVRTINEWMDRDGRCVYVHCYAGQGRSPLAVIAYFALVRKLELSDALDFVRHCRPIARPTTNQLQVLSDLIDARSEE